MRTSIGRSTRLQRWLAATAILLTTCWPSVAHGQTAGELQTATIEDLMKITVTTASRNAEGIADAPAQVEVITQRQIRARGYRSLADLLRDQLGIKQEVASDQDYPSDFTVQGSRGTDHIVLLLDGIRVGSPTNEPLPIMANYPIHNARQVEIVFGPASALYGADAFSAVVNVITRDASEVEGLTATVATGQFGLSNNTATYGRHLGDNGSLVVSGQWFYDRQADLTRFYPDLFQGLQGQRAGVFNTIYGPMAPTQAPSSTFENPIGAHSVNGALRIGGFNVSVFNNRQRASTSIPYTPDNAVYDRDAFQQNDLWVSAGSYTRAFGAVTGVSTFTWSTQTLSPQSGYWNVYSNLRRSYKYAYGSSIKGEQQLLWRPSPHIVITTGGSFERFFAIPQGADLNEPVQSPETPGTILDTTIVDQFNRMAYSNTGGYLQAQYAPGGRWSLTVGTRSDYNSRYGFTVNPRLGVVVKPRAGTTLKMLYGTAFLAPSPYQSSAHYGSFYSTDNGQTYQSDYWHLGNPDLKPQTKTTFQATLTQSIGSLVSLSGTAFNSRLRNMIKRADLDRAAPGVYQGWPVAFIDFPVNEGHQNIVGGAVDLTFLKSWSPTQRLEARFGTSVVGGHTDEGDGEGAFPLGGIAPTQFRAGVDVELGNWTGSASAMAFGRQRLQALTNRVRDTLPGFAVVDVNLRRNRLSRHVDAFLRVENLFDARYFHINERAVTNPEEIVGSPQAPRRLSFGLDVRIGK